jgi:hypothetical protein
MEEICKWTVTILTDPNLEAETETQMCAFVGVEIGWWEWI